MMTKSGVKYMFTPSYKVVLLEAPHTESVWMVAGPDGWFLTACVYVSDGSPDERGMRAVSIVGLLNTCMSIDIDIVARVQSGEFLSVAERTRLMALWGHGVRAKQLIGSLSSGLGFIAFVAGLSGKQLGTGTEAERYALRAAEFFGSFGRVARGLSKGGSSPGVLPADGESVLRIVDEAALAATWPNRYVAMRGREFSWSARRRAIGPTS